MLISLKEWNRIVIWKKYTTITALTQSNKDKADIALDDAENAKNSKQFGKIEKHSDWNAINVFLQWSFNSFYGI